MTETGKKILIAVPTFNNAATIRRVVEEALMTKLPVLVVNDGSTDDTREILAGLPVARIHLPINRGKGVAIRAAIHWADSQGFSHLITLDGDGQHAPADVHLFLSAIQKHPLAIIVGTRNFRQSAAPASSQFGRKFSNFWVKVACGVSVPDSQSGFRAYPVPPLTRIKCRSRRYNYEVEVLVRSAWAGLDIKAVDISVVYSEESKQSSHFHPVMDNIRISMTFTRLVVRNFIPWPHKRLFTTMHNDAIKYMLLNPFKTLKFLFTERSSAREISFAVAVGIFMGTLPLIAMHMVAVLFVATRLRLNRMVALNVSHFCAPPFVPAMAIETGYFVRHGHFLTEFSIQTLGYEALQRLADYLIGAFLLAPVLGGGAGLLAYYAILVYRKLAKRPKSGSGLPTNATTNAS